MAKSAATSRLLVTSQPPPKVIIIGAGWAGVAAAKTYLEINAAADVRIIDADSTVGGTWSASRIYPGLCADSPSGAFEYSDLSMSEELGIPLWSDLDGEMVHKYFERYVRKKGILERCKFNTEFVGVKRSGSGWNVMARHTGSNLPTENIYCDKLIVAAGLTSKPVMPKIDTNAFNGKVFHSKDFGQWHNYLTSDAIQNVTVVGGNKSSVEVARLCAMAGKMVTWLIRPDGKGPGVMLDARRGKKHITELGYARWTGILKPGIYVPRDWWYRFLQSGHSKLGCWLNQIFWKKQMQANTESRYSRSKNGELLKPFVDSLFWVPGISVVHESDEDFLKLVDEEKTVRIQHASISNVKSTGVQLSTGETVSSDAIVFCTGWDPGCKSIFDTSEGVEYGISVPHEKLSAEYSSYWQSLDKAADKYVLDNWAILRSPPGYAKSGPSAQVPYRCFRTIAPTALAAKHDRSLVYIGMLGNSQVPSYAEVSALWAIAYLEDLLPDGTCEGLLGDKEGMDKDVSIMTAFMARRYPGKTRPEAPVEVQSFIDRMMQDLGLRTDRKRAGRESEEGWFGIKGWIREWFEPYVAVDYKGIIQEYLSSRAAFEDKKQV